MEGGQARATAHRTLLAPPWKGAMLLHPPWPSTQSLAVSAGTAFQIVFFFFKWTRWHSSAASIDTVELFCAAYNITGAGSLPKTQLCLEISSLAAVPLSQNRGGEAAAAPPCAPLTWNSPSCIHVHPAPLLLPGLTPV